MKNSNLKITNGDTILNFKFTNFDEEEEINIDRILTIDYSVLEVEILTFPVILNKFGLILADMDSKLSEAKLDLEVYESKTKTKIRNGYIEEGLKYTIDKVDEDLRSQPNWQIRKKLVIQAQKRRDYINSIYWSCKEKSAKLDKLSLTIQSSSNIMEKLIEDGITELNHVKISYRKPLIA